MVLVTIALFALAGFLLGSTVPRAIQRWNTNTLAILAVAAVLLSLSFALAPHMSPDAVFGFVLGAGLAVPTMRLRRKTV